MSTIYMCSVCGAYGKDCALKIGGRDQRVFAWRMLEVRGRMHQMVHIGWQVLVEEKMSEE